MKMPMTVVTISIIRKVMEMAIGMTIVNKWNDNCHNNCNGNNDHNSKGN